MNSNVIIRNNKLVSPTQLPSAARKQNCRYQAPPWEYTCSFSLLYYHTITSLIVKLLSFTAEICDRINKLTMQTQRYLYSKTQALFFSYTKTRSHLFSTHCTRSVCQNMSTHNFLSNTGTTCFDFHSLSLSANCMHQSAPRRGGAWR